jgi:hypothetical protein
VGKTRSGRGSARLGFGEDDERDDSALPASRGEGWDHGTGIRDGVGGQRTARICSAAPKVPCPAALAWWAESRAGYRVAQQSRANFCIRLNAWLESLH